MVSAGGRAAQPKTTDKVHRGRLGRLQAGGECPYGPKIDGHPRDPWGGLTLAHYRSIILDDLTGGYGTGGMVLARMKERYKQLPWTRPHDMAVVFPPLA